MAERLSRFLVVLALLLPAGLRADWTVVDYDMRTDWVAFDFVGWVRVEQTAKLPTPAKGVAAVQLRVIEKLVGSESGPMLTLEYNTTPPDKNGEGLTPAGAHSWNDDIERHAEYLVFLNRQGNGNYRCDELRAFAIVDGKISGLPKAYEVVLGEGVTPGVQEFVARARMAIPALQVRVGRPLLEPAPSGNARRPEMPKDGFDQINQALAAGRSREADQMIYSPDGSSPKNLRALLARSAGSPGWEVRWQAVLGDKAVVLVVPAGSPAQSGAVIQMIRRTGRWHLLNSLTDSPAGRARINELLAGDQFVILHALFAHEHPGLLSGPREPGGR
jgi:hypothetical protein